MADDGQEPDVVAVAAEPGECSRCVVICLLGFVGVGLFTVMIALLCYVIGVGEHRHPPDPRLPLRVAEWLLILCLALGLGPLGLFIVLLQERNLGNPEGERLVDTLLLL